MPDPDGEEVQKDRGAAMHGTRLQALVRQPEWAEFMKIVDLEVDILHHRIMKDKDTGAIDALNSLGRIFSKVSDDIRFGEKCREKLGKLFNGA